MEIKLNGETYQVRELTVKELTDDVILHVRQEAINDANQIAAQLTGKEKIDFLKEAWKSLPKSSEVLEKIDDWFSSLEGIRYILDLSTTPRLQVDVTQMEDIQPFIICALNTFIEQESEGDEGEPQNVPFGENS